jgi:hypothetical protein
MSAPLVVNTRDGACWTRRTVTSGGIALYALADVCKCPEFVMATLAELAERGIVGSADALPMPVGPEPQAQDTTERAKVAELIGDAKPVTDALLVRLGESVRDRREHEHPKWEDLYCLNLVSWMGERMGPVLRRLLDAEARVAELEAAQGKELRRTVSWRLEVLENDCWWDCGRSADSYPEAQDLLARKRAEKPDMGYRLICRTTTDTLPAEQQAASSYPPALPWAKHMDADDLEGFLADLADAASGDDDLTTLAAVESAIATWRVIGEAQHAHNTAPGPDAEAGEPS